MIVLQIPLEAIPDAYDFDDPAEADTHSLLFNTSRKGPPSRFTEYIDRSRLLPVPTHFQVINFKSKFSQNQNQKLNLIIKILNHHQYQYLCGAKDVRSALHIYLHS
jgi:hypothetical protein